MRLLEPIRWIGRGAAAVAAGAGRTAAFAGSVARAATEVRTWLPELGRQARRIGVDSLPIALFIALFTGIVLALQSSYAFTGAVPLYFVGTLVGKTIILELGPVLTGLVLAGRVGANIAAEIGTMRVTEQVDALEMLAYDPLAYLAVPRVTAGLLTFPIVVAFAIGIGVVAGWATSIGLLDLSSQEFVRGLRMFYRPFDLQYALIKSASFGVVVTGVGCLFGYTTSGGAEGVGRATTRAVVVACMTILVLDAFWAMVLL
ncbi:MAG TPA: ABC transporter permease [Gemmatimonadota bacterium]|nr:ABC transporter permease [Gemmatimonadota bacterium]